MKTEVKKIIMEILRYEWHERDNSHTVGAQVEAWANRIVDTIQPRNEVIDSCIETVRDTNKMFFKSGTPQEELDKAYIIRKVLRDEIIRNLLALKTNESKEGK